MKLRIWQLLPLLCLAGCMSYPTQTRPAIKAQNARFATQLAGPATYLAPMPTAVAILKSDNLDRNRAFCAAFMKLPTAEQATAASTLAPNLILTRWLVDQDIPPARLSDCTLLVGAYDYGRAAALVHAAHLSDGSFEGRGPFLMMLVPDETGTHVVGIDGSAYSDMDFDQFIEAWSDKIHLIQSRLTPSHDQPGIAGSVFKLVAAAFGVVGSIIMGVVGAF